MEPFFVVGSGRGAVAPAVLPAGYARTMTAKRSISVPDDVDRWLNDQPNASAAITAAVRAQMQAGRVDEVLRRAGIEVTEAGKARWRDRLATPMPADVLDAGQRMLDEAA